MTESTIIILFSIILALVIISSIFITLSAKSRYTNSLRNIENELIKANSEVERLSIINENQQQELVSKNIKIATTEQNLKNQQQLIEIQKNEFLTMQRNAKLEFEKVANEILEQKTKRFTEVNQQNIETLLKPLDKSISQFKERIEQTFTEQTKQRTSLEAQVKELVETTNRVGAEANNLASALKGNVKKMGNWGEMILESILEQSGLVRDSQYQVQPTINENETGKMLRPDILINLPEDRTVIIDSKVSLVAYDSYCASEDNSAQEQALKEHLRSIYAHIDNLASKGYDNISSSLDFTMLFIPIEPAYMLAIANDASLWSYAYSKRILLISPTNLIACLKLIADLWKREMQSKNAQAIVERAELMYNKFVGFVGNMEQLGRTIDNSQRAYNDAFSQLSSGGGNLIGQAEKLRALGLKSSKKLTQSDD